MFRTYFDPAGSKFFLPIVGGILAILVAALIYCDFAGHHKAHCTTVVMGPHSYGMVCR